MASIRNVKEYWEKNIPQYWYSNLREGTKEYYDEIQRVRYSEAYLYLLKYAEFDKHAGERVLEIGIGQGTDLLQYAKNGAEVYGIDLTRSAIQKASNMFKCYGYHAWLKQMNAEDLSLFENNFFDFVYSFGVLHHTPNTEKTVSEIYRVLKPNGTACIMLYSRGLSWLYLLIFCHLLSGRFLKHTFQQTINRYTEYAENSPLTKIYSKSEVNKLLEGFSDTKIKKLHLYCVKKKNPSFKQRLYYLIVPVIRSSSLLEGLFGGNFIIKVRKG